MESNNFFNFQEFLNSLTKLTIHAFKIDVPFIMIQNYNQLILTLPFQKYQIMRLLIFCIHQNFFIKIKKIKLNIS